MFQENKKEREEPREMKLLLPETNRSTSKCVRIYAELITQTLIQMYSQKHLVLINCS